MKTRLAILAAWLWAALSTRAETVVASPDGRFSVKAGPIIELVDAAGQPLIPLDKDTAKVRQLEVSWSPDSQRVVLLEKTDRGSVVLAAWQTGAAWHKAFQIDPMPGLTELVTRSGSRLVSERRSLGHWLSEKAITMAGELRFADGSRHAYRYTLEFVSRPTPLDWGDYEAGAILGTDYQFE
jgi:hypothetical protein